MNSCKVREELKRMRIGNEHFQYEALYGNKSSRNAVGSFSDAMNKMKENSNDKISTRDSYINSTDYGSFGIYTKTEISQNIEFPIETKRYKIEDASWLEGVPAYKIEDKLTGAGLYIREEYLAIQKDEKTGMEFLINMDQPLSANVRVTDELKNILNDLSEKRNIDIKEMPLQGGLAVNQDPKTGINYLTFRGNEGKGASLIFLSEKDAETFYKIVDEFQTYAVSSQRSTAALYAVLEVSGNLKREKEGFTYLTPDGITYIPYDGDPDKAWEIDMPSSCYSTARKYLAAGNACTDVNTWIKMLQGIKVYYGDVSEDKPYKVNGLGGYSYMFT